MGAAAEKATPTSISLERGDTADEAPGHCGSAAALCSDLNCD